MAELKLCLVAFILPCVALVLSAQTGFYVNRPSYKTWWAKQITPYLYTAGRITDVQMKQAADVGFQSVISLFTFTANSTVGGEVSSDSKLARQLAEDFLGVHYEVILELGEDFAGVEAVRKVTEALLRAPRPILLHCDTSHASTFTALNFLLNQTRFDADFEPRLDCDGFFSAAALHGYDYTSIVERKVVAEISGENMIETPPPMPYSLTNWLDNNFWILKPVHKNLYVAGQLKSNYMGRAKDTGYGVIVNVRPGVTTDGKPSQEEVTLLNIEDNTDTYKNGGRQSRERLLETRVDANRSSGYHEEGSEFNFQSRNVLEYGDDIGYNEIFEREDMDLLGMRYVHIPMGFDFPLSDWEDHKDVWLETASSMESVIIHCRIGFRAVVMAMLTAGHMNGLDSEWAMTRSGQLGFNFHAAGFENVKELFRLVLDHANEH